MPHIALTGAVGLGDRKHGAASTYQLAQAKLATAKLANKKRDLLGSLSCIEAAKVLEPGRGISKHGILIRNQLPEVMSHDIEWIARNGCHGAIDQVRKEFQLGAEPPAW